MAQGIQSGTGLGEPPTINVMGDAEMEPSAARCHLSPVLSESGSHASQDSCHLEAFEPKGLLDVHVKKVSGDMRNFSLERKTSQEGDTGMPTYKMDSNPRGQALIIGIEKFENQVQETRHGSEIDENNLKKLLEELHFEVTVEKDLDKADFTMALNNFADNPKHEKADMMVLTILSHGREGGIFTTDGIPFDVEMIFEKFNNINCPKLKGKPKFFIVQACRGDTRDPGYQEPLGRNIRRSGPPAKKRNIGRDTDSLPFNNHEFGHLNAARPTWEDMVIAYSTIPGFTSNRDHQKGTWFIQSLVEVFMNHAHNQELIDLLRMTSQRLSQFENEYKEKQTCNVELRHLYKRLYFNPGHFIPAHRILMQRSRSTPPTSPRRDEEDQMEQ